ncbi:hypothetical protein ACQ4PT_049767 [Festuca glaucescens]
MLCIRLNLPVGVSKQGHPPIQERRRILGCFGSASGLKVNFTKSSTAPIRCSLAVLLEVSPLLDCPIQALSSTYLGLPLMVLKLTKMDLQPVLDKLAAKLAFWKARLMSRDGRIGYIRAVMAASVVYQLMALDVDPWFIKAVDRLRRGFLWAGREEANGCNCLVAWNVICAPKCIGGLWLHNLKRLHAALRARWIWLHKTNASKPWSRMQFAVVPDAVAIFNASVKIQLHSGSRVLFWEDPWLGGVNVAAIAPAVLALVKPSLVNKRLIADGLPGDAWVRDIAGELSVDAVVQYLHLWRVVQGIILSEGEDSFIWKWMADGRFTTRSAYRDFLNGSTVLPGVAQVWHSFAPFKYRFHAWLALRGRCWTADRRLRKGLPSHTLCPLCSTANETLDHLSLQCPFATAIWTGLLQHARIGIMPPVADSCLTSWWPTTVQQLPSSDSKVPNSAIMLTLRSIWLERNARVFEDVFTPAPRVLALITAEWDMWISCRRGRGRAIT